MADVPIKFIGVGEKLDALEQFHPDRMASRILGGGDLATLAEKAHREFDEDEMLQQQEALLEGKFTLDDFRKQMGQIKKLGSMQSIMKLIPGMGAMADMDPDANPEQDLKRIEGMIDSMTHKERMNPDVIDHGRRNRIAKGSGNDPADVNKLLKDFSKMADTMQKMAGLGMKDRMRMMQEMTSEGGMLDPNANPRKEKQRSKRGPQDIHKFRDTRKKKKKDAKKQRRKNRR